MDGKQYDKLKPGTPVEYRRNNDAFAALLYRLEREGKVNDFVRNNLAVRRSWIRIDDAIPTGAKTELLPLDTPVQWNSAELRTLQARMVKDQTT